MHHLSTPKDGDLWPLGPILEGTTLLTESKAKTTSTLHQIQGDGHHHAVILTWLGNDGNDGK
jgi:hypothetical protein